ncbi:MAG TPA: hypothetical protein VKG23_15725, partial [Thermoanaerobaculia bacterium]|nr:hypothetical protein [Thermoanaerobaculia bacterium]
AFVVAATAWWLATAGETEAGWLADYVAARGGERLARDRATAQNWVREGDGSEADRRRGASELLTVGLAKETAAVESTRSLGASDAARSRALASLRAVATPLSDGLASPEATDPVLSRLAARTPRKTVATLAEWMALEHQVTVKHQAQARADRDAKEKDQEGRRSGRIKKGSPPPRSEDEGESLSPLMEAAVMNRVDGKTNAADIARAVCAEALSAGWWYYGKTNPELVEKYLTREVKDGLLAW